MPAVLLPILGYGLLTAVTIGGGLWGLRELQQYQQRSEDQLRQLQEQQRRQQEESDARMSMILDQMKPFMIAGTIFTTGIGAFIMFRGMSRDRRSQRRREMLETYYED